MRCTKCLYDETIPGIVFDLQGVCNYCHINDQFEKEYPNDKEGMKTLLKLVEKIKKDGKKNKYDVVVGFSGGCDSSYLLHLTKTLGLRPLAVHWDNGWNTNMAESNMHKILKALNVDSYRVTVDKREYNDICRAFMLSGVPDIDIPNDIALTAVLYQACEKFKIKHFFIGHAFRTEGITPITWTYMDGKYIDSVHKKFGKVPMKTYPNLWLKQFVKWAAFKGIQRHRPLYYVDYQKERAKELLSKKYGWEWYGGHHLENQFTAFELDYFFPKRYGVDFRMIGYSALVRSGQMTREEGVAKLKEKLNKTVVATRERVVREELGLSKSDMRLIIIQPRRTHKDYKTYKRTFKLMRPFWWLMYRLNRIPKSFYIKYAK